MVYVDNFLIRMHNSKIYKKVRSKKEEGRGKREEGIIKKKEERRKLYESIELYFMSFGLI
ncbi:hypothetical protein CYANOKiyG1_26660 [Okeania sp. KiyG1]|nr:hypothetical protein CYANOKiyG1_26660 [Okeania sp. KiyG1]